MIKKLTGSLGFKKKGHKHHNHHNKEHAKDGGKAEGAQGSAAPAPAGSKRLTRGKMKKPAAGFHPINLDDLPDVEPKKPAAAADVAAATKEDEASFSNDANFVAKQEQRHRYYEEDAAAVEPTAVVAVRHSGNTNTSNPKTAPVRRSYEA